MHRAVYQKWSPPVDFWFSSNAPVQLVVSLTFTVFSMVIRTLDYDWIAWACCASVAVENKFSIVPTLFAVLVSKKCEWFSWNSWSTSMLIRWQIFDEFLYNFSMVLGLLVLNLHVCTVIHTCQSITWWCAVLLSDTTDCGWIDAWIFEPMGSLRCHSDSIIRYQWLALNCDHRYVCVVFGWCIGMIH